MNKKVQSIVSIPMITTNIDGYTREKVSRSGYSILFTNENWFGMLLNEPE